MNRVDHSEGKAAMGDFSPEQLKLMLERLKLAHDAFAEAISGREPSSDERDRMPHVVGRNHVSPTEIRKLSDVLIAEVRYIRGLLGRGKA